MAESKAQRILIVGGVAGGASCAARLRRMDEFAEIVVFEKGPYVSFANCGLPYHTSGVIKEEASLLLATPEKFRAQFNIDVRTHFEVTGIDRAAKTVEVTNTQTGEVTTEAYDKLVLSPGAEPIRPPLPGIDLPGIFTVRTVPDARAIREWIDTKKVRRAVVIGGGFIGLEMAENLAHRGIACTLIERLPQVMPPADEEMVRPLQAHLREKGIDLRLETSVTGFEQRADGLVVTTDKGDVPAAGLAILAIGVKPLTDLAREAGLALNARGAIKVDEHMRTSDPDVYAIGDAVETINVVTGKPGLLPLAGPANRQGRLVADHLAGRADARFRGVQGTSVVGVFDLTLAQTGPSERQLRAEGVACEKAYLFPGHHVGYYPGAEPIYFKLLFAPGDGRVLGAQAVGKAGVEKRIDVIAMAIQMKATVFDLEEAELCYAPQYGAAKDPVNMAAFIAANHLRDESPIVHWEALETTASRPVLLDVRNPDEIAGGVLEGTVVIPLPELRARLGELPQDRPLWVICGIGQRSHYAVRLLRQKGFDAYYLSGGWKMKNVLGG
ncbi:MAG: hypothetical protein PWP23_2298 [Candidatus Sumerlaeota bacterium]|nr:hypothetical protein [Candidatus Sumerlaeota bacterium]